MTFDLSRGNGERYLEAICDTSLTDRDRARAAMRLHMFPVLTQEVLELARDPSLPDIASYWVGEASFSLLMHRSLPVTSEDFSDFAEGAKRRCTERYIELQSVLPHGWTVDRLREVSGDRTAELRPLLGAAFRVSRGGETEQWPMKLAALVSVNGRFLFWDRDSRNWHVGDEDRSYWFTCEADGTPDLGAAIQKLSPRA